MIGGLQAELCAVSVPVAGICKLLTQRSIKAKPLQLSVVSFTCVRGVLYESICWLQRDGLKGNTQGPGARGILCASGRVSAVCARARAEAGGQRTGHLVTKDVLRQWVQLVLSEPLVPRVYLKQASPKDERKPEVPLASSPSSEFPLGTFWTLQVHAGV